VDAYKYVIDHYGTDAKINAVWLQMGSLLEVQGKAGEAERTYAKVPAGSTEYPEALYRQALLAEQGRTTRKRGACSRSCAPCRKRRMSSASRP